MMERPIIGYVRVSTSEQADSGAGLAAQRAAILAEAKRRGWAEVRIIEDAGYSAKDLRRPGIRLALELLDAGEAGALVVAKLDRLSRSMLDFAGIMARAQKQSWGVIALDVNVDTTSPSGEVMATIMAAFAQFERRLIGQRTRDALAVKKAQGVQLGRPRMLPEAVVDRIVAERASGATMRAIAAGLETDEVPTARGGHWQPGTVAAVLKSAELTSAREAIRRAPR
jgi:DNA invertase Pin-like site-specific DNA recombinase